MHFCNNISYSIYSDVIPPLMDLQPCDAVFGVVFSDLKPPFLGSGDSRGQKHWHGFETKQERWQQGRQIKKFLLFFRINFFGKFCWHFTQVNSSPSDSTT